MTSPEIVSGCPSKPPMFQDRADAGRALARLLVKFRGIPGIVLAVPRGGVPVGAEVACELGMPLEPFPCKKIGHPLNPEYAIGAVTMEDRLLSDRTDVSQDYVEAETDRLRRVMREQMQRLTDGRPSRPVEGMTVILVDDGIATGSTLLGCLPMLRRRNPARIVIAVPVAPPDALERLRAVADEVLCLHTEETFGGVGVFYADFRQVEDEEAAEILRRVETTLHPRIRDGGRKKEGRHA
jgi:putative phosphoribosyl transferase